MVFQPEDSGEEIVATDLFSAIAEDVAERSNAGLRIISMTTVPLRHAGATLGRAGSGFETKVAGAARYAPAPRKG